MPLLRRILLPALAVLMLAIAPQRGLANEFKDMMNRTAIMLGCSLGTLDCRPANSNTNRPRPSISRSDDVALTTDQKRIVQEGLQAEGFYNGDIDGVFGSGTRGAIRDYQSSLGVKRTGYLTDEQTADLMRAAPEYADLAEDDLRLFEIDFHEDLTPPEIRDLQTRLTDQGYDAGPVDGVIGGQTRTAVAAYKSDEGLDGPARATSRLLAYMTETGPAPAPSGTADPRLALQDAPEPEDEGPTPVASQTRYDILGLGLGVLADQSAAIISENLETDMTALLAEGDAFGGNPVLDDGQLILSKDATDPMRDQIAVFFDPADPEGGAIAILRSFLLPEGVTDAQAKQALVEKYGDTTRIGTSLIWVEDPAMRLTIEANPAAVERCGRVTVTFGDRKAWNGIGGPRLDPDMLDSFELGCGAVLSAQIDQGRMTVVLWDSDRIMARKSALAAEAAKPKLKL